MKRVHKSPIAKLKQIDRLLSQIQRHLDQLAAAPHMGTERAVARIATVLSGEGGNCDPSCPTCALLRKYARRRQGLNRPQRAALIENAQSRLKSVPMKITAEQYDTARRIARNRKELASLLGLSRPDLLGWEKRNKRRK